MKIHWVNRRLARVLPPVITKIVRRLPDRAALEIRDRTAMVRRMDYEKADILLNIESLIEHETRLRSCEKEPETVAWIEGFQAGDVFYDIGANVGAYSLLAAKAGAGDVRVYAFEPAAVNYSRLCKNIALNGCGDRVVALPVALANRTELGSFNYTTLEPGGALHALGDPIDYKGDSFLPVFVQALMAYRLDDLVEQFSLPAPNRIKLDVDSIELDILKGAKRTLSNPSVRSLILEIDEGSQVSAEIQSLLKDLGFGVQSKHKYVFGGETGPYSRTYNYIFERVGAESSSQHEQPSTAHMSGEPSQREVIRP
jgi:FkbM family methyltransferase